MTTIDDYRDMAEHTPNCVVLADVADHSTLAVIGEHLGFIEPKFRSLTLEQIDDTPVHMLVINGLAYYYETEDRAVADLHAILSGQLPVRLQSVPESEIEALLARYAGVTATDATEAA